MTAAESVAGSASSAALKPLLSSLSSQSRVLTTSRLLSTVAELGAADSVAALDLNDANLASTCVDMSKDDDVSPPHAVDATYDMSVTPTFEFLPLRRSEFFSNSRRHQSCGAPSNAANVLEHRLPQSDPLPVIMRAFTGEFTPDGTGGWVEIITPTTTPPASRGAHATDAAPTVTAMPPTWSIVARVPFPGRAVADAVIAWPHTARAAALVRWAEGVIAARSAKCRIHGLNSCSSDGTCDCELRWAVLRKWGDKHGVAVNSSVSCDSHSHTKSAVTTADSTIDVFVAADKAVCHVQWHSQTPTTTSHSTSQSQQQRGQQRQPQHQQRQHPQPSRRPRVRTLALADSAVLRLAPAAPQTRWRGCVLTARRDGAVQLVDPRAPPARHHGSEKPSAALSQAGGAGAGAGAVVAHLAQLGGAVTWLHAFGEADATAACARAVLGGDCRRGRRAVKRSSHGQQLGHHRVSHHVSDSESDSDERDGDIDSDRENESWYDVTKVYRDSDTRATPPFASTQATPTPSSACDRLSGVGNPHWFAAASTDGTVCIGDIRRGSSPLDSTASAIAPTQSEHITPSSPLWGLARAPTASERAQSQPSVLYSLRGHPSSVLPLRGAVNTRETAVFLGGGDGVVRAWDVATGLSVAEVAAIPVSWLSSSMQPKPSFIGSNAHNKSESSRTSLFGNVPTDSVTLARTHPAQAWQQAPSPAVVLDNIRTAPWA